MKNKLEYEEFEHMCIVDGSLGSVDSQSSKQQDHHHRSRGGNGGNKDDDEEEEEEGGEFDSKPAKVVSPLT